jgi:hypothetical protein
MSSSYSRREFVVKGALGTAAVGGGLTGAAYAKGTKNVRATPRSTRPPKLWNAATFQEWQERMVGLGPLGHMGGYPALDRWTDAVEEQLQIIGLSTIRDPQVMGPSQQSWTPTGWSLKVTNDHGYGATKFPVASFYPYSGTTPAGGITAPLVDAGTGLDFSKQDFTGTIALVQIPYENSEYETYGDFFAGNTVFNPGTRYLTYDPGNTIDPNGLYRSALMNLLAPQFTQTPALALAAGCVGIVYVMDAAYGDAYAQWLPFAKPFQGIPALILDRDAGRQLQTRVDSVPTTVQLTLTADLAQATVNNLTAILPGQLTDEYIMLLTHLDGTGVAEENGPFALLAMADYLSQFPQSTRRRSVIFHFSYHMTPYVSTNGLDLQMFHPDLYKQCVACFGIEHLGQMNWVDDNISDRFYPTHQTEVSWLGVKNNTALAAIASQAIKQNDLRRYLVASSLFGVGGTHAKNMPSLGDVPIPNQLCTFDGAGHMKEFNASFMRHQVETWLATYQLIDATSTSTLFSSGGPYNNTPPSP